MNDAAQRLAKAEAAYTKACAESRAAYERTVRAKATAAAAYEKARARAKVAYDRIEAAEARALAAEAKAKEAASVAYTKACAQVKADYQKVEAAEAQAVAAEARALAQLERVKAEIDGDRSGPASAQTGLRTGPGGPPGDRPAPGGRTPRKEIYVNGIAYYDEREAAVARADEASEMAYIRARIAYTKARIAYVIAILFTDHETCARAKAARARAKANLQVATAARIKL